MTEVLHSPSSSSSTSISTPSHNAAFFNQSQSFVGDERITRLTAGDLESEAEEGVEERESSEREKRENDRRDQLSLLALLVTLFRKGFWLAFKTDRQNLPGGAAAGGGDVGGGGGAMEIGWPTDVQHVNHVTFDRFDGFLGLPVEFEPEVPRRAPSASATVFGVSTESMQLSYDIRGNIIPTILLLMQRHLYCQGGLQAEGIFRITAGNSQEEFVRDQLNRGVVPEGIDVHCLAGLIKAWFRELPRGVLDSLSPEQVMQCQSEEDSDALVRLLPPTEAALLDWAVNLMADVVQEEHLNKMNARNIAMVFAPNMTQMADPLTALMYAVQVMNFLKMLIEQTLRERENSIKEEASNIPHMEPSDDDGRNQSLSQADQENPDEKSSDKTTQSYLAEDPCSDFGSETNQLDDNTTDEENYLSYSTSTEESDECETPAQVAYSDACPKAADGVRGKMVQSNDLATKPDYPGKGISNLSRINSMTERCEAWR
ncbi:Rho GTPase-activating protein 1 [Castilleja foliolosa]|uniref:Rho GTPase-activating protein 1 n=1 Tax=Castilleja foliolosa TaxID=1961234 RepID=A0ABD3BNC8_9LAMI